MSDPDEAEGGDTFESLLQERVSLECERADLKKELEQLSLDIDELIWQLKYRLKMGDIGYALDLLDRWD